VYCLWPTKTMSPQSTFLYVQDPNPDDPLNKEAAEALVSQRPAFERQVQSAIGRGAHIGSHYFPPCRASS
jgi:hypothetical protein